eukprot:tig00000404_g423.t1
MKANLKSQLNKLNELEAIALEEAKKNSNSNLNSKTKWHVKYNLNQELKADILNLQVKIREKSDKITALRDKLKQMHGTSILPDALRFDEEALLQWEARAGAEIRRTFLIGRLLEWILGTRIDAAALARETKRMFLDFSLECFDYVDEAAEAKNYVPRPIDTREIRGLSLVC